LNKVNKFGETPLHLVSGKQLNESIAEFLLLKGASPFMKNSIGDCPRDLAQRNKNHELLMKIREFEN